MLTLRRVNLDEVPDILRRIEEYGQEVAARLPPHLVLLFGSFVRGDVHEASDVDILVVADFQEAAARYITSSRELGLPLPEPLELPELPVLTVIPVAVP